MAQSPQRPYVPHHTPTRGQPAIPPAEFALAKPFVPGVEPIHAGIQHAAGPELTPEGYSYTSALETGSGETPMASIESFLVTSRQSSVAPATIDDNEDFAEEPEDLPPLEHFLDPLPPIADFSPSQPTVEAERVDSDWVETDWQRYDWKSAAALGETEKAQAEASDAWAETDWEVPAPRRSEPPRAPADAIATALDQIALRIRTGDLSLPGDGSVADPATIAATLAALLGVRR